MRSWIARHPISFMALYTVFYLTAFHWLEVNITVPAIWVHCQLDDVIPFCKYAIVPYFAWFAWIPFTLFYLLRHGERSDFWRVCLCLFAGMTIALSCYVLLPTGLALRPYRVYGSDIFARLVRMLYAVDSSKNVCPSIHVLNTVTLMIGYRRSRAAAGCGLPRMFWAWPSSCPPCCSSSTAASTWCWAQRWPLRWMLPPAASSARERCAAFRSGSEPLLTLRFLWERPEGFCILKFSARRWRGVRAMLQ